MTRLAITGSLLVAAVFAFAGSARPAARVRFPEGEVYRVTLDGVRSNLSASPAGDEYPIVSPDGRRVAFISDRGGQNRLWVVGADGSGLRPVTSALNTDQSLEGQVAWAPDSRRLAVAAFGSILYVTDVQGRQRLVATAPTLMLYPAWSPDGRMIALDYGTYAAPATRVVSADGRRSWRVRGRQTAARWSARNVIAVRRGNSATIYVYDEHGRLIFHLPGRSYAWSPDGKRIATIARDRIEVHDLRGRLLFHRTVQGLLPNGSNGLRWPDDRHLVIGNIGGSATVPTGRVVTVTFPAGRVTNGGGILFGDLSPNGRFVAATTNVHGGLALDVFTRGGHAVRRLVTVRPCPDAIESTIQWFPDGKSLVYDFRCEASTP